MTIPADSLESMHQLTVAWRAVVLDQNPHGDVRDLPGIAVRWADCQFPLWNCIALTDIAPDAALVAEHLSHAADIMRTKTFPGLVAVFEDLLTDDARATLGSAAERAGLHHAFSGTGMAADPLPAPQPEHPDLTFVRVRTEAQLCDYADLNSRAQGFPLEAGRDGLTGSTLWETRVHAYLGLRNGVPVTCAATTEAAGRLFVMLVATDPRWQRRGYGAAVTRKALHEGAKATGLTRATLHATPAGAPVYARMGFKPNSPIHFYGLRTERPGERPTT
ncbi:Acetyltransferase (GNAT) family protein [Saccharopolyspora antimicrobica]|uniref:Acetyltransferase (GNAT) family protein n=1 Tax=Saccharopolyspora antimicrobica TaxID=455193 RepID=A0A1I4REX8_9PSEU|nr:GNAT family N-acetyltransferase [Saccharopolyspora antimicrobica]RKT88038.1 acetyltransferase (GNAT) family protein [Saccharopolyspora antimicrobica]SFM50779.1 Acetyltransferase (GNAT) family protein [Saccharopolyspora antimicrobica]